MGFNLGPLAVNDAEIDTMPPPPIRHDHVVPKRPFLHCTNARQCLPRFEVQEICLKFDPQTLQGLERMRQLQILGFRVDR